MNLKTEIRNWAYLMDKTMKDSHHLSFWSPRFNTDARGKRKNNLYCKSMHSFMSLARTSALSPEPALSPLFDLSCPWMAMKRMATNRPRKEPVAPVTTPACGWVWTTLTVTDFQLSLSLLIMFLCQLNSPFFFFFLFPLLFSFLLSGSDHVICKE